MSKARYLLDTNICIYIRSKKPPKVLEQFRALAAGSVVMSVITFGELYFGAEKSAQRTAAHLALSSLRDVIPVLELPVDAGKFYGATPAMLQSAGMPIGNNDLWIAAHALAQNLVVVTHNTREFGRIPHLRVEDWTQ